MAAAYSLSNLCLAYSEIPLLDHISLTITEGDKIGVVGRNGSGKSSFLRVLAGKETPDAGKIDVRRGLSIAYLPQTPQLRDDDTITEAALTYLSPRGSDSEDSIAHEAQTILTQLGFTNLQQPVRELSGGQRMRVALAGVLCRESDVLLLDEPTNHIDLEMTEWLEKRLLAWKHTLIVVTHDRWLLNRVFQRIIHIGQGHADCYQTDYAGYLEERAQREEMQAATLRKNKSLYRQELQWIRRGAQARSTKAKGRIERFEQLSEAVEEPVSERTLTLKSAQSYLGKKVMSWEHLDVGYPGAPLIKDFSYTLLRDDRVGIIGGNGAGKTTLLRTLSGSITPLAGSIEVGQTVRIGYFSQLTPELEPNMRILDAVSSIATHVYSPDGQLSASQMADTFLFPPAMQQQRVSSLSGGEKRRLQLLRVLMTAPNVLVLDEPTNDLDIETLNVLEDYLDSFQGAVIAVSHDRFFLDRVTSHLFAIEDLTMKPYISGYAQYLESHQATTSAATAAPARANKKTVRSKPANSYENRFSYNEQRDFDTIDAQIAALEAKLQQLSSEIEAHASEYQKVSELMVEQETTQLALDQAMERWLYLQDKYERIKRPTDTVP